VETHATAGRAVLRRVRSQHDVAVMQHRQQPGLVEVLTRVPYAPRMQSARMRKSLSSDGLGVSRSFGTACAWGVHARPETG
jgi:hypothetical protein